MSSKAIFSPIRSSSSKAKISAWVVTSSAVVGSSAINSLGRQAMAIASSARWRMPPEISCGYEAAQDAESLMRALSL